MAEVEFVIDNVNKKRIIDLIKAFGGLEIEQHLGEIKRVEEVREGTTCIMNDIIVGSILIRQTIDGETNFVYEVNKIVYEKTTGKNIDNEIIEYANDIKNDIKKEEDKNSR